MLFRHASRISQETSFDTQQCNKICRGATCSNTDRTPAQLSRKIGHEKKRAGIKRMSLKNPSTAASSKLSV